MKGDELMGDIIIQSGVIIGRAKDIIDYFKKDSIKELEAISFDNDVSEIESAQKEINYNLELINGIYQDLIFEKINYETILEIRFNKNQYEYIIVGRKGE